MTGALQNLHKVLRASLPHIQLGRSGAAEVLSTSGSWRHQHNAAGQSGQSASASSEQHPTTPASSSSELADASAGADANTPSAATAPGGTEPPPPPPLRFVSLEWPAGVHGRPAPPPAASQLPERRLPILFPNITLQMMRLPPDQLDQLKRTGWLREVAFRTTPDVTKLEIAAYLESVYGMSVERVSTINYLGRRRMSINPRTGMQYRFREDDWKKAYVIFRPPGGQPTEGREEQAAGAENAEEEQQRPLIERIREAARAPRRASRRFRWMERP